MAAPRRDSRNRILLAGESQLKNGTYRYRYTDPFGKRQDIYSNRLLPTDRTPSGKREDLSLRQKEDQLFADRLDGIRTADAERETLNALFDKYIASKRKLKESTLGNYLYMYNTYIREGLGKRKIADIKYSDIKSFYTSLILDKNFKPHSMEVIHTVLHPTFDLAVRDEYIRTNPTTAAMREIKKEHDWSSKPRHALTEDEQKAFMEFLASSGKYAYWRLIFTVFLGTGCRVGELIGLCWSGCDFENNMIYIDHNLTYRMGKTQKVKFHTTSPKTPASIRTIPMLKAVKEALLQIREMQLHLGGSKISIDGYKDFVFVSSAGRPYVLKTINAAIKRILRDYEQEDAKRSSLPPNPPIYLSQFATHILHTFLRKRNKSQSNSEYHGTF